MQDLSQAWLNAKQKEENAKQLRLEIEEQILKDTEVKDKGTTDYGDLKISNGFTEKWDQVYVAGLRETVKEEFFPFKIEYKLDRKKFDVLKELHPDLYNKVNEGLTLTPRKPSFKKA